MPRTSTRRPCLLILLALIAGACRESPAEPTGARYELRAVGSAVVYASIQSTLPDPLRVLVTDAATGRPKSDVQVTWTVNGAVRLDSGTSSTDESGVATMPATTTTAGTSRISATVQRQQGPSPTIEVRAITAPVVSDVSPRTITPGATVVVTGQGFVPEAAHAGVLFDGVRGTLISATSSELRVRAPSCIPSRAGSVQAVIGYARSNTLPVTLQGSDTPLALEPGQMRLLSTPAELACLTLPAHPHSRHLLVTLNAAGVTGPSALLEMRTFGSTITASPFEVAAPRGSFADAWELSLRRREAGLERDPRLELHAVGAVPEVGHRRTFEVVNSSQTFDRITAVARVITQHAALYVDVDAESAIDNATLQSFGSNFDAPIYQTMVDVFGTPSDIDGNSRVIILFTPKVNALTPRSSSSFVAGFFYGCDLVSRTRCSGTNGGEVFYSMVPDETGRWGDRRSLATVQASVPPVLAHEFQHMLHFGRRGGSTDALWLSEGLAHTAEEMVAAAFTERGDVLNAQRFSNPNVLRARSYLSRTASTNLISEDSPGSLEMRGGAWLLVQYLRGHYGGDALLKSLTASTRNGVANIEAVTGASWLQILAEFALALWTDPAVIGFPVENRLRFADNSPRRQVGTPYPLLPQTLSWSDLAATLELPTGGLSYAYVDAPATVNTPFRLVLSGPVGASLASNARIAIAVLRVR